MTKIEFLSLYRNTAKPETFIRFSGFNIDYFNAADLSIKTTNYTNIQEIESLFVPRYFNNNEQVYWDSPLASPITIGQICERFGELNFKDNHKDRILELKNLYITSLNKIKLEHILLAMKPEINKTLILDGTHRLTSLSLAAMENPLIEFFINADMIVSNEVDKIFYCDFPVIIKNQSK